MHKYLKKFFIDCDSIKDYYNKLIKKTEQLHYVGTTNEWIIDNYYLIAQYRTFINSENKLSMKLKKSNNIYEIIKKIADKYNYNLNYKILIKELNDYQRKNSFFTYEEVFLIPTLLNFIYISKLSEVVKRLESRLSSSDFILSIISTNDNNDNVSIKDFSEIDFSKPDNIFIFNNEIKRLGRRGKTIFKDFNKFLEENNISLGNVINEEYKTKSELNIVVSNIFRCIKEFSNYSSENIVSSVSFSEKKLEEDKVYKNMVEDTKNIYRNKIIVDSKRKKISEYDYVKQLLNDNEHVGYKLFKHGIKYRFSIYLLINTFFTILASYVLSYYFIPNRILGFIILLIPTSHIIKICLERLIGSFYKPRALFKMDYTNKLPEDKKTMVVIPTIISDIEKIDRVFNQLETFYIANKTKNLYFTLLGDVIEANKKDLDIDIEISNYGKDIADRLNKKYKSNIFNFVYRKRIYNESEDSYLGYERKRGALIQFNKILLGKISKADEKKYFNVNTLSDFNEKIKYVVCLDTDTKLVLNTLLNLIGCMSHPMNRPVLNDKKTKVVSGYGIMQPRMNVDLDSTNKSIYSQIFAGIGGFDTYSSVCPNFNQDVFEEGNFVGKGIYDLEIFDTVLAERFSDNSILSHDLLEGNYLRCGYVSDVEFTEDFPSNYIVDYERKHRWIRGDVQLFPFLLKRIKNKSGQYEDNPLTLYEKYKILNNIKNVLLFPMLFIVILCLIFGVTNKLVFVMYLLFDIELPIIISIKNRLYIKGMKDKVIKYNNILYGLKAVILRTLTIICSLPYSVTVHLDALVRSLYRMFVSKKHLLQWISFEESEKKFNFRFTNFLNKLKINVIVGIILSVIGFYNSNIYAIVFSVLFLVSPVVIYLISKEINYAPKKLNTKENNQLQLLAEKTWSYFEENLTIENNYLIPDNFQELRDNQFDIKTSPTNIGFSLISVISAYELGFIDIDRAISYLEKILNTVNSLEKWNGHLYNWYNIKTKEVMNPRFISTVDSGNLIACIIIVRGFLLDKDEVLVELCDKLINKANFKKLYTNSDIFSIGYLEDEKNLSVYNYNKFASESRLTSFIAIAKGDVPPKHWFCLDKSLTSYKNRKGLTSWGGSAFEYFMPLLFMNNYHNTLLDEAYKFAYFCNKDYVKSINKNLPWGISEAAYNDLDNGENYKYKSFSVPYLKAKEEKKSRIVISPYSSLMALELNPSNVYDNIIRMRQMNMIFKYGFYESYDYDTKSVVRACFAHHQGMIMMSITNYLNNNILKKYFHKNIFIKSFDILLKEKVQLKSNINIKIAKYKKYDYRRENIEDDIRKFNYVSDMPEVSILSNRKYTLLMNDRGNSFSRFRTLQLNRYRKVTEQDYGMFMYIRDIDTNKVWSNTYAPTNVEADSYEVVFSSDKIKYIRKDGQISTKTEVIVTSYDNAEIRKITFKNESDSLKTLELTTYTEPILCENPADISHKVFNNMFLRTMYDDKTNSFIAIRENKQTGSKIYMINRLLIDDNKYEYTYENDRLKFIGRGNYLSNPKALYHELSNPKTSSIDNILSIRNKIEIEPTSEKVVYFIAGFGRSMEQIKKIISSYNNKLSINTAFSLSSFMNKMITKNMNLTGSNMKLYNTMLNYLYQTTKISITKERKEYLAENALSQKELWKFGISGDRPIILVKISSIVNISFVYDILKAFEYFKNKSIFVDIVIINSEKNDNVKLLNNIIDEEKYRIYKENSFSHTPGNIIVINEDSISEAEKSLLRIVPRLKFNITSNSTLEEEIYKLEQNNKISRLKTYPLQKNINVIRSDKLKYFNGFGGFNSKGNEYVIDNVNTPLPWSNVISNGNFGTIITNNGCGYTYGYNSGEYKITSWTNETVINDKSEGIRINGKIFDPSYCRHGFGYSVLSAETNDLKQELTEFVASCENVKVYLLKLTNKTKKKQKVDLTFYINPTLGNFEEKTARHILSEYMKNENFLKLRNVYSIDYSDVITFLSSSEKITSATTDKILTKDINVNVTIDPSEEKEVVFTLGCAKGDLETLTLIYKYKKKNIVKDELKKVKKYWNNELSKIKVKTPSESFDYMINGWYLYQAISSRIYARAGYYQVSGAYGFRDQLQDCMNLCIVDSEKTKKQILINASHQFIEGDVLHWWHEHNKFGLRSKYKDDYLWLLYAVLYYIQITSDYEILEEEVPFVIGDKLTKHENEKTIIFRYSENKEKLFNHLLLALDLSMNELGKHGIPLIGGGDWNDGMNLVGIKGKGESVWLGFFLYDIINNFIKIINKHYKYIDTTVYEEFNSKLKDNLNKNGFDKTYYLRAFFDNGDKLGSSDNEECKIDLISQSFSILSGVASKDREKSVIEAVEQNLVDHENKIIKLLDPPFDKSLNYPGYIMNYPKGIRENGGQYTHAVAWYIMALCKLGYNEKAYEYYQMINPVERTKTSDDVLSYKIEPYTISADIYDADGLKARGGWSWYTGSAAWFYRIGIEEILGIKRRGKNLYIEPKIPSEWKTFSLVYTYEQTIYNIKVILSNENKIEFDNNEIKFRNKINLVDDNKKHDVIVYIKGGNNND